MADVGGGETGSHPASKNKTQMKIIVASLVLSLLVTFNSSAAPAAYATAVLNDNPYVYYRLGETSGMTATDSSANGLNGTYVNNPTLGVVGDNGTNGGDTSAQFAGASGPANNTAATEWVDSTANGFGSLLGNSSFEFVLKTTTTNIETLFGVYNNGTATGVQITLNQNASGSATPLPDAIRFYLRDDGSNAKGVCFTNIALFDGNYHHLVITYTNSGTVNAYVDGVAQTLSAASPAGVPGTGTFSNFAYDPMFAARNSRYPGGSPGTVLDQFNGTLDEVALYPQVLSAAQVAAHYNALANGLNTGAPATTTPVLSTTTNPPAGTVVTVLETLSAGVAPFSYQWQSNAVNLGTAAASSLATNALAVDTTGFAVGNYSYRVVVTNLYGAATSAPVVLTIAGPSLPAVPPITNTVGLAAVLNQDGTYAITSTVPAWTFGGDLGVQPVDVAVTSAADNLGSYSEITFSYTNVTRQTAGIRLYASQPVVLFTETTTAATPNSSFKFPLLASYPSSLYHVSYGSLFGVYNFSTLYSDSPWLYFDTNYNSFIISPATNYMIAGDVLQGGSISCGIDSGITQLPAGFTHRSVLVVQNGINQTFGTWGKVLTSLSGKVGPANDAGVDLNKLGYWTDHYAAYYYAYNSTLGYTGTLLAVKNEFATNGLPLGYLQLDSWWYPKGSDDIWTDTSGGIYLYVADTNLFPGGLAGFQQQLGLPLITHSRWIDPSSPYNSEYTMSANVCIDPAFWTNVMDYIQNGGAATYEQDWLQQYPPAMNLNDPPAYMNNMQSAAAADGINLQYCTPTARHYLQASLYTNATTIRVSGDGFGTSRWDAFIYDSRLAGAMGIWPWSDVYKSSQTRSLLISILSAGPVGVGDALGAENFTNLLHAVRQDSVIVKPDAPLAPLDQVYVGDAQGQTPPMVASTYTDHDGFRAAYVFAYARSSSYLGTSFVPSELGIAGNAYVYDYFNHTGTLVSGGNPFNFSTTTKNDTSGDSYFIVVPIGPSEIGFLGDTNKFVTLGRQRIAALSDSGVLWVQVTFGQGETNVMLSGYAPSTPYASTNGSPDAVAYDTVNHYFTVNVAPSGNGGNSLLALSLSPLPVNTVLPPLQAMMTGGQLQISWPASLMGYVVEKATTLVPPVNWVSVTNEVSLMGDQNVILETPTDAAAFYRLRQ